MHTVGFLREIINIIFLIKKLINQLYKQPPNFLK